MILIFTIPTVQFCLRCINVYLQQWVSLRFAYFNMVHLCVFNCFLLLFFQWKDASPDKLMDSKLRCVLDPTGNLSVS